MISLLILILFKKLKPFLLRAPAALYYSIQVQNIYCTTCLQKRKQKGYIGELSHDDKLSSRELFTLCFSMVTSRTKPAFQAFQPLNEGILFWKIQ
jgi:hypothetical protein